MDDQKKLRKHLMELLEGRSAHVGLDEAIKAFPITKINERVKNSPHTAWELLEHIRIAQRDILEFSRDAEHVSPDWPEGYWNHLQATEKDWKRSVKQVLKDLESIREMVVNRKSDLFARFPHGTGQTLLREVLVLADHNAYHLGQLMLIRRIVEKS